MLWVWREIRSSGVSIGIVEGNRDFFLDESELVAEIDWSARVHDFRSGNRSYRLVHGDLVNRRDLQYRFWSTVSKSNLARVWARLLPRPVAVGIVRRMESHLAKTNQKFRYTKPIEDLKNSAEAAWAAGIDVIFWGHFHTPWTHTEDGRQALIIPAWLESRVSVLVEDSGDWSLVNDALEPQPLVDDASIAAVPGDGS
jgi:UDP-2,3-diacylglucosamine pyrophosphatase LpxH